MIDIPTIKESQFYAKIIDIKLPNKKNTENNCKEYQYTIIDENGVKTSILIHDERIWKERGLTWNGLL